MLQMQPLHVSTHLRHANAGDGVAMLKVQCLRLQAESSSGSEGDGAKLQRMAARRRGQRAVLEDEDEDSADLAGARTGSPEEEPPAKRPRSAAQQPPQAQPDQAAQQRRSVLDEDTDEDDEDDWAVPARAQNGALCCSCTLQSGNTWPSWPLLGKGNAMVPEEWDAEGMGC
jgi:hypothetical protein